jgi:LmbE family N-acetylglucosaminyl deacetylase
MEKILAFGCHPDDIEFQSAGTLALLAAAGHEVHLATMAGGEVGSQELTNQQIRARRLKEAEKSARVIGGAYHYAGGKDLEVEYNLAYRQKAVKVMRDVNPTIVFTNPPSDYLIDHEITSQLVRNAAFIASVPLFDCGVPTAPMENIPYLYYWNAVGSKDIFGRPLPVTFGIDISGVIETKKEMLACHESQDEWLRYINKADAYIRWMVENSADQGKLIERPYGECFIQHVGNGHPTDNILSKLLPKYSVKID